MDTDGAHRAGSALGTPSSSDRVDSDPLERSIIIMAKPAAKVKAREYANFIGGQWSAPSSGNYIENRNPADMRELIGRFPASTANDVDAAF